MAYLIIFSPLLGFLIAGLFGRKIGDLVSQVLTSSLVGLSAIISCYYLYLFISGSEALNFVIFNWISSGSLNLNWSIYIDALTAVMLVVVTVVSFLVHVYSIGYMSHDPDKPRFMGYLSLFTFAMLMLITSDNFLQLFFGWEGVGLASYLLIGFWFKKPSANAAAIKAFVVNRVGDFGLAIGIFLIYKYTGSLNFSEVFQSIPSLVDKKINFIGIEGNIITFICVFLFIGAMGKSAQLFLHTWLPDAMEGPTPVSALIHAATMVTAGVFLVVRCSPIYEYSAISQSLIITVGASTAFFAATIGLVQNDIKKIIAYSTCSQLGYMFFAAGIGAYHIAIFHLFTHAFFKALLFLCAGSVIHSLHEEQDIRKMGGIYKKIPYTYAFMVIGTLAITGFPFLSGFYSKDAILEAAFFSSNSMGSYATIIGVITAILTSIYSWRLIYKTFHGNYRNENYAFEKIHESPLVILAPLFLLTLGAVFVGFLFKDVFIGIDNQVFWNGSIFFKEKFVLQHPPYWFLYFTPVIGFLIIFIAYYLYVKNVNILNQLKETHKPVYEFLLNKWYFDEFYEILFVKPAKAFGNFLWSKGDEKIIDGYGPNGFAKIIKIISDKAVLFQSGYLYHYAFVILIGLTVLLTYLII
ncbi:NADH-quinone oxidoreductase subunit L [Pelagibacteraceae bacterium]|nr:NADH-quinone oxidoreductase subunit L [Pelagibacteraceae bacterium]